MSRTAVIVDAIRTPVGKGKAPTDSRPGGALSGLHPADLLGQLLQQLMARNDVDPGRVDDVITGCVSQLANSQAASGDGRGWRPDFPSMCRQLPSTAPAGPASRPATSRRRE
jgi:acetyl-CoA acyltransferase